MFVLDTSQIFFDGLDVPFYEDFGDLVDSQETWLQGALSSSTATWKIAYGHHPYLSNGPHGNAGSYEGLPGGVWYASGVEIQEFIDGQICGNVDLYLSGHDHSRQWLTETCNGTAFMVSGAGAKTTDFEGSNATYWQDDTTEGFTWFEIIGNTMTVQWWDKNGVMNYDGVITK